MSGNDFETPAHGALFLDRRSRLDSPWGEFRLQVFRRFDDHRWAVAAVHGDVTGGQRLLARVHSSCMTSESLGGCDCDCVEQLNGALEAIATEGRGVVFYLLQEGRGAGLVAKARDRMLVQASEHRLTTFEAYERLGLPPDCRRYDAVVAMRQLLGIEAPLELLTNNPQKVSDLEREKVPIAATRALRRGRSVFNSHYLNAKRQQGHTLGDGARDRIASLPEKVSWEDPVSLPGSELLRVASYLLPVGPLDAPGIEPSICWLRMSVYADAWMRRERVVLEYRGESDREPFACFPPETLLQRFASRAPTARDRWLACVSRFVERGAGVAVFLPGSLEARPSVAIDADSARLMEHHLAGRPSTRLALQPGERGEAVS